MLAGACTKLPPPRNGGDVTVEFSGPVWLGSKGILDKDPTGVGDGVGSSSVDVGRVMMGPDGLTGPSDGVAPVSVSVSVTVVAGAFPPTAGIEIGTPALEHSVITALETAFVIVSTNPMLTQSQAWGDYEGITDRTGLVHCRLARRRE